MEEKIIVKQNKENQQNQNAQDIFDLKDLQKFTSTQNKKTRDSQRLEIFDKQTDFQNLLNDSRLYCCFSMKQRLKQKLQQYTYKQNYKEYLNAQNLKLNKEEIINSKIVDNKGMLRIKILQTQNILRNQYMKNPFVKIHFVNYTTGEYIKKNNQKQKNFLHNDNLLCYNKELKFDIQQNFDTISTQNCDIQQNKINQGLWNEELIINTQDIQIDENMLILFEILDYDLNFLYDKQKQSKLNKYNQIKLYWGYLKLKGHQNVNQGFLDIQLFQYKFDYSKLKDKQILQNIPEVYLDFIWPVKSKIDSCLKINLFFDQCLNIEKVKKNPKNIFQIEDGLLDLQVCDSNKKQTLSSDLQKCSENEKHREFLNSIIYTENKATEIPQKIYTTLETGYYGSLCLKFSNSGSKFAYTITFQNNLSIVRVFDIEQNCQQGDLYFHNDIIHDMQWHISDQYIISSSSDCSCKIFRVPEGQFTSTENKNFVQTVVSTQDFCYSCQFFYPETDDKNLFFVISNKKGFIYFYKYSISQNKQQELLCLNLQEEDQNEFANCLKTQDDKLYVGHSNGKITIFSIEYIFDKIKLLRNKCIRVSDSMINQIQYIKNESCLLVLSRDNYIRMLNLKNYRIPNIYSNANFQNTNVKFCISGDEQIILSGSENGKIHFWDIYSADYIETKLNHCIKGIIAQVSWNSKYNMIALGGFGSQYPVCLYY